ncbi:MAG: hypothetical protein WC877_00305 [Dehalococcoidales bacterium]|jgi:hypothetical protein
MPEWEGEYGGYGGSYSEDYAARLSLQQLRDEVIKVENELKNKKEQHLVENQTKLDKSCIDLINTIKKLTVNGDECVVFKCSTCGYAPCYVVVNYPAQFVGIATKKSPETCLFRSDIKPKWEEYNVH